MSSYILSYLNGSNNLEIIQAISLWGSKDEKKKYLFLSDEKQMRSFVRKIAGRAIIHSKEKKISDSRRSYHFEAVYPYGNAFKMTVARFDTICKHSFCVSSRLP